MIASLFDIIINTVIYIVSTISDTLPSISSPLPSGGAGGGFWGSGFWGSGLLFINWNPDLEAFKIGSLSTAFWAY